MSTKPRPTLVGFLLFLTLFPPCAARADDPAEGLLRQARGPLIERIEVARQRLVDWDDDAIARGNRDPVRHRRINRLLGMAPEQIGAVYESTAVCAATLELLRFDPLFRKPGPAVVLNEARDAALQLLLPLLPGSHYLISADYPEYLAGRVNDGPVREESLPLALLGAMVPASGRSVDGELPLADIPPVDVGGGRADWRGVKPVPGRNEAIAWTGDQLFRVFLDGRTRPLPLGPIAPGTTPDVSASGTEVAALIPQEVPGDHVRLAIRRLDGPPEWKTIHDLRPGPPRFSPRRPFLAWMAGWQLRLYDVESDTFRVLPTLEEPAGWFPSLPVTPTWSPDGAWIALLTGTGVQDGTPKRRDPMDALRMGGVIAPFHVSPKWWTLQLITQVMAEMARPADAPVIILPLDIDRARFQGWDVDSRHLLTVQSRGRESEFGIMALDGDSTLVGPATLDSLPSGWVAVGSSPSPDGRWYAMNLVPDEVGPRDRENEDPADPVTGLVRIEMLPAAREAGTSCDPAPPLESASGTMLWHPSSRWFVVSDCGPGWPGLRLLDLATGEWCVLAPACARDVGFTSDGDWLLWREEAEERFHLMAREFPMKECGLSGARRLAEEGRTGLDRRENAAALARFLEAARLSGLDASFFQGGGTAAARLARSAVDPLPAEIAWSSAARWFLSGVEIRADQIRSRTDLNDAVGRWAVLRGARLGRQSRTAALAALDESPDRRNGPGPEGKDARARALCERALLWNPRDDASRALLNGLLGRGVTR